MPKGFSRKWRHKSREEPLKERIKHAVRSDPFKPRLENAVKLIEAQIRRLHQTNDRFRQRDQTLFASIVNAHTKHDIPRANILAAELAEMRKMEKMIMHSALALEQLSLRLQTVSEMGEVVTKLGPAARVLGAVSTEMAQMFPEAERELGQVGHLLNGLVAEATHTTGRAISFETLNEDAEKILSEAATVAEQQVKERFPEMPVAAQTSTPRETAAPTTNHSGIDQSSHQ